MFFYNDFEIQNCTEFKFTQCQFYKTTKLTNINKLIISMTIFSSQVKIKQY